MRDKSDGLLLTGNGHGFGARDDVVPVKRLRSQGLISTTFLLVLEIVYFFVANPKAVGVQTTQAGCSQSLLRQYFVHNFFLLVSWL